MSDTPKQAPEDIKRAPPERSSNARPEDNEPREAPEQRNAPVFGYLAILFAVAAVIAVLGIVFQKRIMKFLEMRSHRDK